MKKRKTTDKRRTKVFKGKRECELERNKCNLNVEVAFTNDVEKTYQKLLTQTMKNRPMIRNGWWRMQRQHKIDNQ
jgi:hypothetical protein